MFFNCGFQWESNDDCVTDDCVTEGISEKSSSSAGGRKDSARERLSRYQLILKYD